MTQLFQALGVIQGIVSEDNKRLYIEIDNKKYPLFSAFGTKNAATFKALISHLKQTENPVLKLAVYPNVLHLPNSLHSLRWEVVAFTQANGYTGIFERLKPLEFQFSGIWQRIPCCKIPVISVKKNYNSVRKIEIESFNEVKKKLFLKQTHIPILWQESPIPARMTAKGIKEFTFIDIKATFDGDIFIFDSLVGMPTEEVPKYFKAQKASRTKKTLPKIVSGSKPSVTLKPKKKIDKPKLVNRL